MRAIRVSHFGGPEVLRYAELPLPEPGASEARVKIEAAGVNFIDIYHRTGLYPGRLRACSRRDRRSHRRGCSRSNLPELLARHRMRSAAHRKPPREF